MVRGRVDRLRVARSRSVAAAIVRRAEMRAALDHLPGNADVGCPGIVAAVLAPAAWVLGDAASFWRIGFVLPRIPVGGPFPDVADHVVDAITVRRKRRHRRGALEPVVVGILAWEFALPGVGHVTAVWRELVTPGKFGAVEPAARGELPFGLGRQVFAGPLCIGKRIAESHVHDGMIVESVDVAPWPIRMPPVRALQERPPLAVVA